MMQMEKMLRLFQVWHFEIEEERSQFRYLDCDYFLARSPTPRVKLISALFWYL